MAQTKPNDDNDPINDSDDDERPKSLSDTRIVEACKYLSKFISDLPAETQAGFHQKTILQ